MFHGREESLQRIHDYMMDDSDKVLVLYGEGGCGKTSLLAKSASMCTSIDWFVGSRPIIIIRFLGTTPDSSALTPTLISICQQVLRSRRRRFPRTNQFLFADILQSRDFIRHNTGRHRAVDGPFQATLNISYQRTTVASIYGFCRSINRNARRQ